MATTTQPTVTNLNLKHFFYWSVGGVALIALAGPYPDMATLLVVILIIGFILSSPHGGGDPHWKTLFSILDTNTPPSVKKQQGKK